MMQRGRKHQTTASNTVQSDLFADWQVGQRVVTQDGIVGTIVAREDGPFPQTESYEIVYDGDMGQGWHATRDIRASVDSGTMPVIAGRTVAAEDYPELSGVVEEWPSAEVAIEGRRSEREVPVRLSRKQDVVEASQREAKKDIWDYIPGAKWLGDALHEQADRRGHTYETRPSIDWCRYRADSQCWYPRRLDEAATEQYGVPIWKADSRGYCERSRWSEQETCPMGWPEIRSGHAASLPQFFDPRNPDPNPMSRAAANSKQWAEGEKLMREAKAVESAWADVRAKAVRIRRGGGVSILSVVGNQVAARVQGDNGVYESVLTYEPGTQRVALWECGCEWAKYSWGRSGRWKRLEGRMCSHTLAAVYEMQSRGFGGATPRADDEADILPADLVRGARKVDFPAKVRGVPKKIVDVTDGVATTLDGEVVAGDEVEHEKYHPTLGLTANQIAVLKDEPEPALPSTTGEMDEDDDEFLFDERVAGVEIGAPSNEQDLQNPEKTRLLSETFDDPESDQISQALTTASLEDLRPAWLDPSSAGSSPAAMQADRMEIAAAAKAFLKEGVKTFSASEQEELIGEAPAGSGLARNLDRLDLTGTHYEADIGSDIFS